LELLKEFTDLYKTRANFLWIANIPLVQINRKRPSVFEGLLFYKQHYGKEIIPEPEREHSCAGGM
jgi:hypothetical protein